ncbi:hypothetical protein NEUTE2DRAFT_51974, partial [Neurospora tetrasperma FGSC 2509]
NSRQGEEDDSGPDSNQLEQGSPLQEVLVAYMYLYPSQRFATACHHTRKVKMG